MFCFYRVQPAQTDNVEEIYCEHQSLLGGLG